MSSTPNGNWPVSGYMALVLYHWLNTMIFPLE